MTDFWAENMRASTSPAELPHVLIDLGYVKHPVTRRRCDRLLALGLGKRNIQIVYLGRLLVRIPPAKVNVVLRACPGIRRKITYSWTTHSWIPKGADDLKYSCR